MEEAGGRKKKNVSITGGCVVRWRERESMNTFLPRVFKVKIAALSCYTIKEIRALGERDKGQMNGFPLSTCNIYQYLKNVGHNSWTVCQNKINNEACWAHQLLGAGELSPNVLQTRSFPLLLLTESSWFYLHSYGRWKRWRNTHSPFFFFINWNSLAKNTTSFQMSSRLIFHTYVNTVQVALSYFRWGLGLVYKLPTVPLSPWIRSQETWDVAFLTTCLIPNKTRGCPGFSWNQNGMQQWDGSVYWFPSFPKSFRCVSLSLAVCGSPQIDQSFNTNPERGHRAQSCLSLLLGFPLLSGSVAMRGAEGIIPSWTASASTKAPTQILWRRHESFHQLQATLDPAQASQPNDSSVRFFPQKHREKMKLSQLVGVHADEFPPLYFVNKQRAVTILLIPVFVHHSWDKSKGVLNPILLLESF